MRVSRGWQAVEGNVHTGSECHHETDSSIREIIHLTKQIQQRRRVIFSESSSQLGQVSAEEPYQHPADRLVIRSYAINTALQLS